MQWQREPCGRPGDHSGLVSCVKKLGFGWEGWEKKVCFVSYCVLLCFLLKHVTIWFLCFEVANSCSVQKRMAFLHRGWVSFYEAWKVMLFIGKGLSIHIFQFILENIKPHKPQGGKEAVWCGYDLDRDMHISKCPLGRKNI